MNGDIYKPVLQHLTKSGKFMAQLMLEHGSPQAKQKSYQQRLEKLIILDFVVEHGFIVVPLVPGQGATYR